ncbi:MAG: MgtC/SapB family protein [Deltaproteobacteria bacterium]|nr:MgtC/SapB family protein [Deltaproteobacteria bacterium]
MGSFELEALFKIFLAVALGGVIGLERQLHGRAAGLRTHMLVCLASALLIVASQTEAFSGLMARPGVNLNVDPGRIAAGIITGIGFLGAGAILRIHDNFVRGLTTAACIWLAAALGIAVGFGAYMLAGAATALALVTLTFLDKIEHHFDSPAYRTMVVVTRGADTRDSDRLCREILEKRGVKVQSQDLRLLPLDDTADLTFLLRASLKVDAGELVSAVAAIPGVTEVRWT